MDYSGERLLPGQLGHFFIILSLVASLAATFAYFKATASKNSPEKDSWKRLARISFIIEAISVTAVLGLIVLQPGLDCQSALRRPPDGVGWTLVGSHRPEGHHSIAGKLGNFTAIKGNQFNE